MEFEKIVGEALSSATQDGRVHDVFAISKVILLMRGTNYVIDGRFDNEFMDGTPLGQAMRYRAPADVVDALLKHQRVDLNDALRRNRPSYTSESWMQVAEIYNASAAVMRVLTKHGGIPYVMPTFWDICFGGKTKHIVEAEEVAVAQAVDEAVV